MRFTIKREEFLKGLNIASRAVSNKVAMPVLENLKLELTDRGLFITGSNLDITIKTQVPYKLGETEVIRNYKEGATLVKAKLLTDIIRSIDSDEITLDVIDSTNTVITNNRSKFRLNSIRVDEYLDIDLEANGTELTLSANDFNTLVNQTAFAASTKEQRPVLTAVNLEARDGLLTAIATDSYRMAKKTLSIPLGIEFSANVPARMLIQVSHLLEEKDEIQITFSDKKALFIIGTTIIATRLIAGDYPNTKNIIPKITNCTLEANAQDLIKAIERANLLSIDRQNVVNLTMSEESVNISAASRQDGSADESIEPFKYNGPSLKVSFNSEFVLAAIKALGSDDVTFAFVAEMKPFIVENASDDSAIQVVTPVHPY